MPMKIHELRIPNVALPGAEGFPRLVFFRKLLNRYLKLMLQICCEKGIAYPHECID